MDGIHIVAFAEEEDPGCHFQNKNCLLLSSRLDFVAQNDSINSSIT